MAENISIKVTTIGVNGATGALSKLTQLKGVVDYLNRTPVNINAGGLTQVSVQAGKAAQATQSAAKATKDYATATQTAEKQTSALGNAISRLNLVATGMAVMAVVKSIREAVSTMKEVDQQLTNIQKVSNMTAAEVKKIGDAAYDTASKYGVAADKYLEAVYTFQKAGLGDSAEKLGELATKTMLVGDTTASVATKFLISANAAWKLGGSVEALSKIVDEADYINNNYAATLADIAAGLPIVGATAAQVGMTTEQTMSAIATIVASTGQTASKASTALRAIIMNLIGQTGELEDGVAVTEESIKSLNDVLQKYAPNALAAAQASGKILDPMEAIAALAKAAEDPLVKETELFSVLASLGGKLRTTQLTALVNNLDMYNKMLTGTADAAGTADREVSIMLESWNSKTQILKNTWTQFISSFISSDIVKGGITALTSLIKVLNSDFGRFVITITAVTAAISLLRRGILAFTGSSFVSGLTVMVTGLITTITGLTTATEAFTLAWKTSPFAVLAVGVTAVYGLVKAYDALTVTTEEYTEKLKNAKSEYESQQSKIDEINTKLAENRRELEEVNKLGKNDDYRIRLEDENEKLEQQLLLLRERQRLEAELAAKTASKTLSKKYDANLGGATGLSGLSIYQYANLYKNQTSAKGQEEWLDLVDAITEARDALQRYLDLGGKLSTKQQEQLEAANEFLDAYFDELKAKEEVIEETQKTTEVVQEQTQAQEEQTEVVEEAVDAFKAYNDAIDSVQSALSTLTAAQEEYNEYGELSVDTLQSLLALDADYLDALIDENGQINLNADSISDLIDGKRVLLEKLAAEAISTYALETAQELYNEQLDKLNGSDGIGSNAQTTLGNLASAAGDVGEAFLTASGDMTPFFAQLGALADGLGLDDIGTNALTQRVTDYANNVQALLNNVSVGGSGWTPKGSGSSSRSGGSYGSATDTELAAKKSAVSLAKQKLSFASESGASTAEQVALMRLVQEELHKEAEYLRGIEGESERVIALSTEWWTYQNKINKALEETKESYDDIKDAAIARIDAEEARVLGPLQEQLENLKAQRDAVRDEREEEERLLEVEKARIALENAQKERTVRQYNAATGQWEWVANAANVSAAQENLAQAEQALSDFYVDREIDELEAKIASIQNDYSQQRVIAEMQANSAAWFDADEATRKKLAADNLKLGTEQGWTRGADGAWYDSNGNRVYDGGGILRGRGGIKASVGDEMVIPPSMTARLLTAEATGAFDALLNHLGIVTSAANSYAGFGGGLTKNSIGQQHNGDTFYIDGVMMQNITESTTLGQLARTARTLSLCKGA